MKQLIKQDCLSCVYLNVNGTCGNRRSVMYGVITTKPSYPPQLCNDRRYYDKEAFKKYKRKRKKQSIYDYE